MRRVVVTGCGAITPLGDSPPDLVRSLAGTSGLARSDAFAAAGVAPRLLGRVADFDPERYLGEGNYRPLDRTGQLTASAAARAIAAAARPADAPAAGLVLGTAFGGLRTTMEFDRRALTAGPTYVRPLDFANTVLNAAAGQAAIWHKLTGLNATFAGGTTASLQALAYAAGQIRGGRAEALLAGGADELSADLVIVLERAGWCCPAEGGRPVPLDARRDGFAPAEAACLFVLEPAESAAARGAEVLGEILGWGNAFDLSRGRDPGAASSALERAARAALDDAQCGPDAIDAVSLSANGGRALDRDEARALERLLGDRAAEVPVAAVKSALGESLGAAGALQALALFAAARSGGLPPPLGLGERDPEIALGARARQDRPIRRGLVTALGLDGQAAALVVAAAP